MKFKMNMPMFHGTSSDFPSFSLFEGGGVSRSPVGKLGVSLADEQGVDVANHFADQASRKTGDQAGHAGANVLPLFHRTENPTSLQLSGETLNPEVFATVLDAWKNGHDAIRMDNYIIPEIGDARSVYLIEDPVQLRSRFAAFDPMRRDSSDLLAGGLLGVPMLRKYF